jgi:hypothetical protein
VDSVVVSAALAALADLVIAVVGLAAKAVMASRANLARNAGLVEIGVGDSAVKLHWF